MKLIKISLIYNSGIELEPDVIFECKRSTKSLIKQISSGEQRCYSRLPHERKIIPRTRGLQFLC